MEEYFKIYFLPKKKIGRYAEFFSEKFIKKYTKFFYNRADVITVPSTAIKRHLRKCGVNKNIIVLPTGIDINFFKPKTKRQNNLVLWVGRLGKEKNLDVLLKAFVLIQKIFPETKLIVVGDGPEKKNLEELAKKFSLNAEFKGYIPREELPKFYSSATVFVSPSTTETQGLTVLEAFACGCPVVVANSLGFKDFVNDGKNGFFSKPKSKKDLAEKITKLLKNKKLRERLSKNARKTAEEYSITNQAKKLERLYSELLQKIFK